MSKNNTKNSSGILSKAANNELHKTILDLLSTAANYKPSDKDASCINTQVELISKVFTRLTELLNRGSYVTSRGYSKELNPKDLLDIQNTLSLAVKLRADILSQPLGAKEMSIIMKNLNYEPISDTKDSGITGLDSPPKELKPVDKETPEEQNNKYKDIKVEDNDIEDTIIKDLVVIDK